MGTISAIIKAAPNMPYLKGAENLDTFQYTLVWMQVVQWNFEIK